jgi:hypothetical protein
MPLNPRIRDNSVFGAVEDNPLATNANTINSAGLASLSVVASKHAVITLDPLRQYGNPEIILVTAHSASSSVATIVRGAYGTTARPHPQGTLWVHAPIDADFIEIVTSITRPSDPYEGQFIFETDTNKLVGYGGTDWAPRDAGGVLGYSEVVVTQAGITAAAGIVDLTNLSVTVTVGTGRRIRVSGKTMASGTDVSTRFIIFIQEGASFLQRIWDGAVNIANVSKNAYGAVILTPSAGSHTYKLSVDNITGPGTVGTEAGVGLPSYILVEDIGAA